MTNYTFADQARAFETSAARGVAYAAIDRVERMRAVLVDAIQVYRSLYEAIGEDDRITLALQDLYSMAKEVERNASADIMDAGLLCDLPIIDTADLDALVAEVKS